MDVRIYKGAWITKNPIFRNMGEQIFIKNGWDFAYFDSETKLYHHLISNNVQLIAIDADFSDNLVDYVSFLRSVFRQMSIVVLADNDRYELLDLMKVGGDYLIYPPVISSIEIIFERCFSRIIVPQVDGQEAYSNNGWVLTPQLNQLSFPDGQNINLTLTERELLKTVFKHVGQECSFEYIAISLGIDPTDSYRHRIEVIISRLRRKFREKMYFDFPLISVRGFGYSFVPQRPSIKDKRADFGTSLITRNEKMISSVMDNAGKVSWKIL